MRQQPFKQMRGAKNQPGQPGDDVDALIARAIQKQNEMQQAKQAGAPAAGAPAPAGAKADAGAAPAPAPKK